MNQHELNAWTLHDHGDHDRAIESMSVAIQENPKNPRLYCSLGHFLRQRGDLEAARDAAMHAIKLCDTTEHAWTLLGLVLRDSERFEESAWAFRQSIALREDKNVYTLLASSELQFAPDLAAKSAAMALKIDPEWEEAKKVLHRAESRMQS